MHIFSNIEIQWLQYLFLITIVLAVAITANWLINKFVNVYFDKRADELKVDATNYSFLKNASGFIIFSIAIYFILVNIPVLKNVTNTVFAGAGVIAAIIGFASQQAISNIISGIFLIIFRPFRVDDIIEIEPLHKGVVEDITLRHTIIRNFENKRVIVPNNVINNAVIVNSDIADEMVRRQIEIGISYTADMDKAIAIMKEEAMKHALYRDNRSTQDKAHNIDAVDVRVVELGEYFVKLRAYVWTDDHVSGFRLHTDLNKALKKRFDAEGIEFPYPYRNVIIKKED